LPIILPKSGDFGYWAERGGFQSLATSATLHGETMVENNPLPDDEDDGEYELEPVDPEILDRERHLAERRIREAESAVDVDEVYRDTEPADPITWDELRNFRFTIRHLLIVTALLALLLTFIELGGWLGLFLAGAAALAAGWFFVLRKEHRVRVERERRLAQLDLPAAPAQPRETQVSVAPPFRFSFSMKEMFIALTAAAVVFGLVRMLGGPENAAILLGMVALVGLGVHLLGFDPPPLVILGWWLLLVLYIVVTLWAAFGSSSPTP
jgi:hypothetical protein